VKEAALKLASRRVFVFPCEGKIPMVSRGVLDATTDPHRIRSWWGHWPAANIGIATGLSGLVVIDIDRKNGVDGETSLVRLEAELGDLPQTVTATTPSGGRHIFFRTDIEVRPRAGRVGAILSPGVDVRGGASYVVAAPSTICGRSYSWVRPSPPLSYIPPGWLAAMIAKPAAPPTAPWRPRTLHEGDVALKWCVAAVEREAQLVRTAPLGTRNDRLWRSAAALAGLPSSAITDSEIRQALLHAASSWRDRTPSKDVATIDRGIAFGRQHPRSLPDLMERRAHG
jgi:hypothetical protein